MSEEDNCECRIFRNKISKQFERDKDRLYFGIKIENVVTKTIFL